MNVTNNALSLLVFLHNLTCLVLYHQHLQVPNPAIYYDPGDF